MTEEGQNQGAAGPPEGEGQAAAAPSESTAPGPADAPDRPRNEGGAVEPGAPAPVVHKHFVAPALIPLERVDDDPAFRVRLEEELEDVAALATDIARLGQLFPIDVRLRPPDHFQVITGFRRVAALRFLQREKVLARLHTDLDDGDATLMALAAAIHGRAVSSEALEATKARLEQAGRLTPAARDMLEKVLSPGPELGPEQVEEEVDADELAAEVTVRLGQVNQDLSLLADVFAELDEGRRSALLQQLKYSAELVEYLEAHR
jgi:ParB family transcriptional regulator, chromosome partitioning protein